MMCAEANSGSSAIAPAVELLGDRGVVATSARHQIVRLGEQLHRAQRRGGDPLEHPLGAGDARDLLAEKAAEAAGESPQRVDEIAFSPRLFTETGNDPAAIGLQQVGAEYVGRSDLFQRAGDDGTDAPISQRHLAGRLSEQWRVLVRLHQTKRITDALTGGDGHERGVRELASESRFEQTVQGGVTATVVEGRDEDSVALLKAELLSNHDPGGGIAKEGQPEASHGE